MSTEHLNGPYSVTIRNDAGGPFIAPWGELIDGGGDTVGIFANPKEGQQMADAANHALGL